jgi:TolB-like protein
VGGHPISSIAVLPFENLSHNPSEEWFPDGMPETLITELSKIRSLKIISRTSVMQYNGTQKPLKQIASELGVEAIVEGSALRAEGKVRITAQLIEASTDTHLWGDDFDSEVKDVFTLQRNIAQRIARAVGAIAAVGAAYAAGSRVCRQSAGPGGISKRRVPDEPE